MRQVLIFTIIFAMVTGVCPVVINATSSEETVVYTVNADKIVLDRYQGIGVNWCTAGGGVVLTERQREVLDERMDFMNPKIVRIMLGSSNIWGYTKEKGKYQAACSTGSSPPCTDRQSNHKGSRWRSVDTAGGLQSV